MRTILFFDLPSITSEDRREYRKFVKVLITNGFYRLQESVFCKMAIDFQSASTTVDKIKKLVPKEGLIMALTVTEKQFSSMKILLGNSNTDVITTDDRIVEL